MQAIAWIEPSGAPGAAGLWGAPAELALPLADRGLQLADGLFETLLVEAGQPLLLSAHLQRWSQSAALLGMEPPPGDERVRALLAEAVSRSGIHTGALRLNWSRGAPAVEAGAGGATGPRGVELPAPGAPSLQPRFWLQLTAAAPQFDPVPVIVSRRERRNASSLLSRCKTFAYGPAIEARREARAAGAADALLESTAGGLCCATTANLLVRRDGQWFTPPLASGCLPGVMRGRALALGLVREGPCPLGPGSAVLLINSLGCRPALSVNGSPLPLEPEPEAFWRRLLAAG